MGNISNGLPKYRDINEFAKSQNGIKNGWNPEAPPKEVNVKEAMSIYDKIVSDTKREKTLGLLGYGIQGVSALRDLAENANQEYSQPPNDVYNKRIEYKPVDIEPYIAKMEQSEAGYLKYLKETGNGHLIPSLMSMGSQKNELAAKMTEANNQKEVSIAGANAQSDLQTMQINQSLRSDYNKQKFAEMQYRDNSMRSNKSSIFGSIAGMISTGAGATSKELKLEAYKEAIAKGDMQGAYDLIMGMAGVEKKANQTYKYQTEE